MNETIKAQLKHLRVAPRKTRLLADSIRGLSVNEAEAQLLYSTKHASSNLLKLLHSATANAINNFHFERGRLYIKEIRVDQGQKSKRWNPRARGSVNKIEKKTSHVTLVLGLSKEPKTEKYFFKPKEKKLKQTKETKIKEKSKAEKTDEIKSSSQPNLFKKVFRRKSI